MKSLSVSFRSFAAALAVPALLSGLLAGCAGGGFDLHPLASHPGHDAASDLRVAESALTAGDTELAVTLFERALKADPRSIGAQIGLGDVMYQNNDLPRAGVLYAQAAAAAPDDPRAQLGLARVALRERRLDDAVARYGRLAAAYPDNPVAAEGLGTALDLQGRHDEAQAVYRTALGRHPEAQGVRNDLGLSLILAGQPREGANVLLDIAALSGSPAQARQNLAFAYGVLGNDEAARRILLADMPSASVDDNLRFYARVRAALPAGGGGEAARADAKAGERGTRGGADK
ncbi:hypothetical protein LIG30_2560 [Burkholderia sp. lig30]|jgi:Flp pilus assembly protein TadD|uniref:tetratricopeptide repeat protein n=1 Tax=Burkholderia sp. lig30 TaxID=1192124 RepID=UPI0004619CC0|nr:tetratricopeptide repeat protein [Burkholderia sp. lig30]KDB08369.1 hypothetical protein LIG30_2560 [Burkholderia sp. lig30]